MPNNKLTNLPIVTSASGSDRIYIVTNYEDGSPSLTGDSKQISFSSFTQSITGGTSGTSGTSGLSGIDGTSGTSGVNGVSSGAIYYFNQSVTQTPLSLKQIATEPTSASTQEVTINLTNNATGVTVSEFISDASGLGFTIIPGGAQRFFLYFTKDKQTDNPEVYVELELANSGGTSYGQVLTTNKVPIGWNINNQIPVELDLDVVFPKTNINLTDRMIVRIKVDNLDNSSYPIKFYTEGNSTYSFVITTVGLLGNTSGTSGTDGTSGTSGTSGTNGTSGTSGIDGNLTPIVSVTGTTYTLSLSDGSKYIRANNINPITIEIPDNLTTTFTIGTTITIEQTGNGVVTVNGASGVIVNTAEGNKTNGQYTVVMIHKVDVDEWTLIGGVI